MSIAVVDYGMGNLRSVANALQSVSGRQRVEISSDPGTIELADRIVFPGQGAMPACMHELEARGLREAILRAANSKPFLGICVGLQMLFAYSEEGDAQGLAIFPGEVRHFCSGQQHGQRLKVPHMGWNRVRQIQQSSTARQKAHPLWRNIDDGSHFYFVHSYYVAPQEPDIIVARSDYGLEFSAAVARDNIFAVQFHPEKSDNDGLELLRNFVSWRP